MTKGIMLKRRGKKRKTFQKNFDREITRVNGIVFADLLIPGPHNCTQHTAVLAVMDGFSRFVTTCLLNREQW
ncbi:hypothetical protein PHPALM_28599 [Phytophthora palmivora]|uniref:Integrase catalytic domain-containing protein n=1 Tax=Phytophthora palmivora TaxID=4796 RepID=A0A2P4X9R2_9STRA|nr:hypothetical protein PHPALM_28599 [Phytophthora palmivora]